MGIELTEEDERQLDLGARRFSDLPFQEALRAMTWGQSLTVISSQASISRSKMHRLMSGADQPTPAEMTTLAAAYGKASAYFIEFRRGCVVSLVIRHLQRDPALTTCLYQRIASR